jgi:hypothetical protein
MREVGAYVYLAASLRQADSPEFMVEASAAVHPA